MKEVKINIPSPLAGWHLLTRAAVPRWTHVQVKALCQGELEYDRVQKALMKMFGGDHRPNVKDIKAGGSSAKDDGFFEEDYETVYEEDEAYDTYAYEDYEWGYEEEAYEADEYEEEDPEIDEAVDQEINVNPCQRDFRFGGGEVLRSHYEVTFPAYVNGQRLQLTASVVPGSTPFLISRPTLEAWCAKQDFSKGTMQVMNGQWFKPERGHRGHYVLDLLNRDEVCMMEESPSDPWHIELTLELDALETNDEAFLEIEDHQTLVAEVTKKATQSKSLLFFELYVDKGNLATSLAEKYDDVTVATFSLPEWDFSKVSVRTAFLKLLKAERPHFVWIAPPCTKWSKMQNLCALTPEYQSYLQDVRAEEESSHLWLTKRVSDYCENDDAGFGFEHPKEALSWKTETIESMNKDIYKDAICDRCQTGLVYRDSSGIVVGKVKKSTKIRTNSDSVFEALHLQCQCNPGEHIPMEGKSRALRAMQNYERGFTDRVAPAIYDTMVESWRKRETMKILVSEELNDMEVDDEKQKDRKPDISPEDKELMRTHGKKAYQIVSKLHRQLGHPSNDKLCRALHDAKFPSEVIEVAKNFSCSNCNSDVQKKIPKPASLPQASHFNELMEIDVFHIKWDDKKYKILAAIDVYSRYEINALMKRETEEEELGILEKQWFNVFGAPEKVKTDSSGAHMSESYQQRLNDFGSKLLLVPKEAHYKMGIVERLHAVRRLQLLKMKRDFPDLELSRYLLFVASANELASEKPMALTILDWQSRKLPRMCRSSLSAESQASSAAVDELEWLKVFAAAMVDPFINISEDSTMSKFGPSPLITDAKSLFDAARSVSSGLRLSEKRTAIEVTIVRERLEALGGHWRWVNSAQQLADGLTKPTSRENFAEQLRRGVHQLKFDPTYTAAKKVGRDARNQELEEHEAVSKQLFGEALLGEVVHDETVCLLPECNKKVEKKHGHEKYCSRRHFYKHRHRSELLNDDVWRKSALTACGILTCEALPKAAALQVHVEIEDGDALKFFFTFMILVLCFSFGLKDHLQQVLLTMFNWVIHPPVENQAEEIFEPEAEDATRRHEILNDNDPAIPEIENDGEEPEVEDSPHRHDAGSSTVNDDTDLDDEEWARWQRIKAAVIEEPSQHFWRRRLEKARDFRNKEVDIHTRTIVVNEDFTNSRIRRYKETHQVEDTHHVTEEEIACWNRQFNRSLRFIYDAGWHVSLKRKERDEMEYTENLVTRLSFFEVHDKIVQTPLTFDPNLGRNQFVTARPHEHGAYEFHNDFYPHIR
eukprot:g2213.t1